MAVDRVVERSRGEFVSEGRNPRTRSIVGSHVSLVIDGDEPRVVARFRLDRDIGEYELVDDDDLLRALLFRMSARTLRDTRELNMLIGPAGAASGREAGIGRSRSSGEDLERMVRDFVGKARSILERADADIDQMWRPRDLGDEQAAIMYYGGKPPYSARETQAQLELTRQGLAQRRKTGKLLGLPIGPRRVKYPAWQFDFRRSDNLVAELAKVLGAAPRDDPWGVADILTSPQPSIASRVPIDVLRAGDVSAETLEEIIGLVDDAA
jgi:hypothetical protein